MQKMIEGSFNPELQKTQKYSMACNLATTELAHRQQSTGISIGREREVKETRGIKTKAELFFS